jgi:uroporphyrinogen-III decarboxylase
MTEKQRVHATLAGQPPRDCSGRPIRVVATPYQMLYYQDHFSEVSGRPAWELHKWLHADPPEHVAMFRAMHQRVPFGTIQPQGTPPRELRDRIEFFEKDGAGFRRDRRTGAIEPVLATKSGHAIDYAAEAECKVFTAADIAAIRVRHCEQRLRAGELDYAQETVRQMGHDHFIVAGGVIGTVYSCSWHVGLVNVFEMMAAQPKLIDELCKRILEDNIEAIRSVAACGGDAIYIDEATSTGDMISPAHYGRFSLPYVREMVAEIHRLGQKAILIYFGAVMDRLDQIASIGADAMICEASMKGFRNDIGAIASQVGSAMTLFGNIDPIAVLQNGSDSELDAEMRRQAIACETARGFIMSTGSPITPSTPLERVQRFLREGSRAGLP